MGLECPLQVQPLLRRPPLCPHLQMLSFMHAQYSFFQQGYSLLHQLDPYMKTLAAEVALWQGGTGLGSLSGASLSPLHLQLDQLVIASAVEKREMERKHAAIQQRVRPCPALLTGPRRHHLPSAPLQAADLGGLPARLPRPFPGLPTLQRLALLLFGTGPPAWGPQHSAVGWAGLWPPTARPGLGGPWAMPSAHRCWPGAQSSIFL